jgi:hypothetical protein
MENKSMYVGNGRLIQGQQKEGFNLTINLNQLWAFLKTEEGQKATFESQKGEKYVKLSAWPLNNPPADRKDTHSVKLDTWQPPKKQEPQPESGLPESETLPF